MLDVKRERELDERRKNEKLEIPDEHPVRKLLMRMYERHAARIAYSRLQQQQQQMEPGMGEKAGMDYSSITSAIDHNGMMPPQFGVNGSTRSPMAIPGVGGVQSDYSQQFEDVTSRLASMERMLNTLVRGMLHQSASGTATGVTSAIEVCKKVTQLTAKVRCNSLCLAPVLPQPIKPESI